MKEKKGEKKNRRTECKECIKKYKHEYYIKNRERRRIYNKKYREENKDKIRQKQKEYYEKNRIKLIKASNERSKIWSQKIKYEVLSHYSHLSTPVCRQCGMSDIRTLSIDHIKGGGGDHRRELFGKNRKGGRHFYRWLQDNNYPEGYQVLCMNCQWIKRYENGELRKNDNKMS